MDTHPMTDLDKARIEVVCILKGGPDRTIEVDGKDYYFEMNPRVGPCPQTKRRAERKTPWPRKVWAAVQIWIEQGKQLDAEEYCVWTIRGDWYEEYAHLLTRRYP